MSETSKDSFFIGFIKYILPVIIVIVGFGGASAMFMSKKKPSEKEVERIVPTVDWVEVKQASVELSVSTQGVVAARRSTLLISEVSGVVEWVSPALYAGGFFNEGELLLKIETTQYEAALANAKSLVAQMELLYQQEFALSEQALQDWTEMGKGEPSDLVLRKPQLAKSKADLEFAQASLKLAERNLAYTQVRAPYQGRVQAKYVDVGQSVTAKGSQLAAIYSVDAAEIRVSLSQQEAAFVDLPEVYVDSSLSGSKPSARVATTYGGETYEWEGYLDRTEGVIDPATRLVYAVVVVDEPYRLSDNADRPPLKVGMFVNVEMEGKVVPDAFSIPRGGLNPNDLIYVLNEQNQLEMREVKVVKRGIDDIIVSSGLKDGERVVTTRLSAVSEGMLLDPIDHENETVSNPDSKLP